MNVHVAALLHQILSLHRKMLMGKSCSELWSNITGLAISTDSNRSVNYVNCVVCYSMMCSMVTAELKLCSLLSYCAVVENIKPVNVSLQQFAKVCFGTLEHLT